MEIDDGGVRVRECGPDVRDLLSELRDIGRRLHECGMMLRDFRPGCAILG